MIYDEAIETMPRSELEAVQGERLAALTARVYDRVPFYKKALDDAGVSPDEIKGLDDLKRLPFTRKRDLRDNYPFGLFAVPMDQVIRVHASSGTTGKPTVVGYTRADIDIWADVCARSLAASGAEPGMMFQNAYGYGLFTGGLGMHYGAERLGLTVIPVSGGNTARQVMLIQDFMPHVMACTPSYALTICDRLIAAGVDPENINLRTFILGAEPWTDEMRKSIEAKLPVNAVNIYGLSEIIGPGVSNECVEAKDGSHVFEDHFIVEAVDPETGEQVPDGEVGELVFTTLTKEAIPLLRYRTGDRATVNRERCICGRTHARMGRILGRTDDMLIIRGVNVFPSQIEAALLGVSELAPHHRIIVTKKGNHDHLAVEVEAVQATDDAGYNTLAARAKTAVHEILGLNVDMTVTPPNTLPRSEGGKLSRLVDRRNA
ncbi:MAG: phenylacetate--CoA ligase [Acidobacteriota bacterium]|nr:phenylacetate--CoA ligase [Acidobacteriota bacterium]